MITVKLPCFVSGFAYSNNAAFNRLFPSQVHRSCLTMDSVNAFSILDFCFMMPYLIPASSAVSWILM